MKITYSLSLSQSSVLPILNVRRFVSKKVSLLTFCLMMIVGSTVAQITSLFSPSSLTDGQLTSSQYLIKQSYQSRSNVASVQLVDFSTPSQIQQSVTIGLQIPGSSTSYTFTAKTREAYSNGDYSWYGDLSGVSNITNSSLLPDGSISIIGSSGKLVGEMRIDTSYYGFPSFGEGLNGLVVYDETTGEEGGSVCSSMGGGPVDTISQPDDRAPCPVVDVLILYTQEAKDTFPDVEDIARLAFQNTKQGLLNSEVWPEQVDLHLTGVALLPGFTATGAWPNDSIPILQANSPAQQLRDEYHADLVFILVPSVYPLFSGAVFGFGDLPADGARAFTFVEVETANLPHYTFSHELGHLFGGRHQWADDCETNDDGSGIQDAHAHSWQKSPTWPWGKFYKTITSACYDIGKRITVLHYSNPDVCYGTRSTGVPGWANNAKTIRNAVCRISNYVTHHDINVFTEQPINYVCPGYSFSFRGYAVGDFGPYEFHWKYKLGSGGSWIDYPTTGPQDDFDFVVPANFYGTNYVELTATNGTDVGTASTYAYSDYLNCPHRPARNRVSEGSEKKVAMSIVPNPAKDMIEVYMAEPTIGTIEVTVINSLGEICLSKTISSGETSTAHFSVNLQSIPNGAYILEAKRYGLPTQAHKFLIAR